MTALFTPGPHPLEECALRLAALCAATPGELHRQLAEDRRGLHWIVRLTGNTDGVESIAFSPDGHLLATASSDRTVRLWDVADQRRIREVATMTGHSKPVDAVAFSRDGRYVITGSEDWTAMLWRINPRMSPDVCDTAYPIITHAEWKEFLHGIAYRPPCPIR